MFARLNFFQLKYLRGLYLWFTLLLFQVVTHVIPSVAVRVRGVTLTVRVRLFVSALQHVSGSYDQCVARTERPMIMSVKWKDMPVWTNVTSTLTSLACVVSKFKVKVIVLDVELCSAIHFQEHSLCRLPYDAAILKISLLDQSDLDRPTENSAEWNFSTVC